MKFILHNLVVSLFVISILASASTLAAVEFSQNNLAAEAQVIADHLTDEAEGFLSGIGRLIEKRVGWLRPQTIKEMALLWIGLAIALPWSLLGWIKPLLQRGNIVVRLIAVAAVTALAVYSGWKIWGHAIGADQFASTLLIALPLLLVYFNSIVAGMKVNAPAEQRS